jgi:imidazolonepropionase-like amidohydrolase
MRKFMRLLASAVLLGFAGIVVWLGIGLARPLAPIPLFGAAAQRLAIVNVSVIDVESGQSIGGQTVIVEKGRIAKVGDTAVTAVPPDLTQVDGRGKFLIPALQDSHIHSFSQSPRFHFPLLLAHGVTSVRDMGDGCSWDIDLDCVPNRQIWDSAGANVAILTPRIADSSSYHFEDRLDATEARQVAERLKQRGDTLIKLQLPDDIADSDMAHITAAARSVGLPLAGHIPEMIELSEQDLARFASIEHGDQLRTQCQLLAARHGWRNEDCGPLLQQMARHGTAFVPTFIASTGQDVALGSDPVGEAEKLGFAPSPIATIWRVYRTMHRSGMGAEDIARAQQYHRETQRLTITAHRMGVRVLAGSDALDPFVLHGTALHDELASLVAAGFAPADALRSATIVPAIHHGTAAYRGKIAQGYAADILLLGSNPLTSIAATRDIDMVITRDRLFDRAELQRLKDFARQQANSHALNARLWWSLLFG